jgi:hypothetical protein
LRGVSLPAATLDDDLGLYAHPAAEIGVPHIEIPGAPTVPSVRSVIMSGKTQVKVGPGIRTGNSIDLTYATANAPDTHSDAMGAIQFWLKFFRSPSALAPTQSSVPSSKLWLHPSNQT